MTSYQLDFLKALCSVELIKVDTNDGHSASRTNLQTQSLVYYNLSTDEYSITEFGRIFVVLNEIKEK